VRACKIWAPGNQPGALRPLTLDWISFEKTICRGHDGRPYFDGETEPCINGTILAAGAYFGEASDCLVDRLLNEQLEDGGWNCEAPMS
jgi:hypothetical protein